MFPQVLLIHTQNRNTYKMATSGGPLLIHATDSQLHDIDCPPLPSCKALAPSPLLDVNAYSICISAARNKL